MRLLKRRTAVSFCILAIPLSGRALHAECSTEDVVEIGRLPDVIFPPGQPSCVVISPALIGSHAVPSGLEGNCGTFVQVLNGDSHRQVANPGSSLGSVKCRPFNNLSAGEFDEVVGNGQYTWSSGYLEIYSDGTPGFGTIEFGSNDSTAQDTGNLNGAPYPIGFLNYFVTNSITDNAFTQTATTGNMGPQGNTTIISNPVLNGQPGMALNVTQVWNYGGGECPPGSSNCGFNGGACNTLNCIYNNHPIAVIYGYDQPGYWSIVNSDGGGMPVGAAFNVEFAPETSYNLFTTYTTSAYDSYASTIMDYNSGALIFPTSRDGWDPYPNGVEFLQDVNEWAITNTADQGMVASSFSTLMIGSLDPAAYIFNQSASSISGASMFFNRFSGLGLADPVALTHIFVAPQTSASNELPSPLGVWWDGTEWAAFREDVQAMPSTASINVYAHRPAFIAAPLIRGRPSATKGDTNGDHISDFTMIASVGSIESGIAQSEGAYSWFTPLQTGDGNAIDQDFTTVWAQSPNVTVLSGDFDGDGRTDLALTGVSGWGTIPLALSNGDGSYRVTNNGVTGYEPDFSTPGTVQQLPILAGNILASPYLDPNFTTYAAAPGVAAVAGDFNGDGITDIALTAGSDWWTIPVAFSHGDAEGTFVSVNASIAGGDDPNFPYYATAAGVKVVSGDFNGDGVDDIALVGGNYGAPWASVPLALSNGDGTFNCNNDQWSGSAAFGAYAATATLMASGDFNNDGYSDVAVISGGGPIEIAFSHGDGKTFWYTSVANPFSYLASQANVQLVAGDYNGDGYVDLLLVGGIVGGGAGAIGELISEGNGNFNPFLQNLGTQLATYPTGGGVKVLSGSY
jgi:hypothetical protein